MNAIADRIAFDPALPLAALAALALIGLGALALYAFRGGGATASRAAGGALIFLGLLQPLVISERRTPAPDIAAIIVDQSESMRLAGRAEAAKAAGEALARQLAAANLDVRVKEARGGPDGTALVTALQEALADAPRERLAGSILVTEGQISDAPADPKALRGLGPVHAVVVGDPARGDRRLELLSAPAFGIVGDIVTLEARVDDPAPGALVPITVAIDGALVRRFETPAGTPFQVRLAAPKRGPSMVTVEAGAAAEEITLDNNRAAFELTGVRDRLRVLLVTGEPHAGARVWRNLLKSDPSVDLVQFVILRPPEKQDFTPEEELSLISFPTRELFSEKLQGFDLIIFDRYRSRGGIMPHYYFENIARRVESGGALLAVAGPADAGGESVFQTPLAAILPSRPTGGMHERPFRPATTELGRRHPVTRGLPDPQAWGRWTRQIDASATSGQAVLSGVDGRPLLVLARAGRGRVAQLWSDQAWLWARGYEGGGPHGELLRRLAHWLMQEPELDENRLSLRSTPNGLVAERATLGGAPGPVEIVAPDGESRSVAMEEAAPGLYRAQVQPEAQGLYEARLDNFRAFAAVGPLNPQEAAALSATGELLRPLAAATGGGVFFAGERAQTLPEARRVEAGARASGSDWLGLEQRQSYTVTASAAEPLGPGWAWAMAGLLLLIWSWRREAR